MSSIASSPYFGSSPSVAKSRGKSRLYFALIGLAAVVAAGLANIIVFYLGDAVIGYDPEFVELGSAIGDGIFTMVLAIPAVLVYAVLLRRSSNPVRHFTIISAVALLISVIPDFTYVPSEPGVSNAQITVLVLMHIVAAAVIVWTLTTFARPQGR
jgi:Family of unknown function (DUF6069)